MAFDDGDMREMRMEGKRVTRREHDSQEEKDGERAQEREL